MHSIDSSKRYSTRKIISRYVDFLQLLNHFQINSIKKRFTKPTFVYGQRLNHLKECEIIEARNALIISVRAFHMAMQTKRHLMNNDIQLPSY